MTIVAAVLAALDVEPALGSAVGDLADEEMEPVVARVLGDFA